QPDRETSTQVVVWRCHTAKIRRRPVPRFLAVRSAPVDVSLPQNEKEVCRVRTYLANHAGQRVSTKILPDSTYDEFTEMTRAFCPGVIHRAIHGTAEAFQFNSPPSNDLVEFGSLARFFGRQDSVTTVISTACFSAQPTVLGNEDSVC